MALQDKAYCISSAFFHLPNSKSDVTILANSPVISLVVVPAFGGLWQAGNAWGGASLIWHVFQILQASEIKGWSFNTARKILFVRLNNIVYCFGFGYCSIKLM